jgi:hypothetical protein
MRRAAHCDIAQLLPGEGNVDFVLRRWRGATIEIGAGGVRRNPHGSAEI